MRALGRSTLSAVCAVTIKLKARWRRDTAYFLCVYAWSGSTRTWAEGGWDGNRKHW